MSELKIEDLNVTVNETETTEVKGGGTVPTESISLNYERIRWTY